MGSNTSMQFLFPMFLTQGASLHKYGGCKDGFVLNLSNHFSSVMMILHEIFLFFCCVMLDNWPWTSHRPRLVWTCISVCFVLLMNVCWCFPHVGSVQCRVCVTVRCPSVHPSVRLFAIRPFISLSDCPINWQQQWCGAGLLLSLGACSRYQSTAASTVYWLRAIDW